jgi:Holliday junction DNA helicase RuvB
MIEENTIEAEQKERLVTSQKKAEDNEVSIRPRTLQEYIGQEPLKQNLKIFIEAAKKRNEPLEHIIFYGPPGLGKTTLAMFRPRNACTIKVTSGPAIERPVI